MSDDKQRQCRLCRWSRSIDARDAYRCHRSPVAVAVDAGHWCAEWVRWASEPDDVASLSTQVDESVGAAIDVALASADVPGPWPVSLADRVRLLAEVVEGFRARHAELAAIVAKLPHTADGVPITPGKGIYGPTGRIFEASEFIYTYKGEWRIRNVYLGEVYAASMCYSSRHAYEAAASGRGRE